MRETSSVFSHAHDRSPTRSRRFPHSRRTDATANTRWRASCSQRRVSRCFGGCASSRVRDWPDAALPCMRRSTSCTTSADAVTSFRAGGILSMASVACIRDRAAGRLHRRRISYAARGTALRAVRTCGGKPCNQNGVSRVASNIELAERLLFAARPAPLHRLLPVRPACLRCQCRYRTFILSHVCQHRKRFRVHMCWRRAPRTRLTRPSNRARTCPRTRARARSSRRSTRCEPARDS